MQKLKNQNRREFIEGAAFSAAGLMVVPRHVKGGIPAMSNFEYASKLTEITLLGVLSLRLGGQKVYWDSKEMKATGLPEADIFIREPVRKGWGMA
jgi:hypothetical protein